MRFLRVLPTALQTVPGESHFRIRGIRHPVVIIRKPESHLSDETGDGDQGKREQKRPRPTVTLQHHAEHEGRDQSRREQGAIGTGQTEMPRHVPSKMAGMRCLNSLSTADQ